MALFDGKFSRVFFYVVYDKYMFEGRSFQHRYGISSKTIALAKVRVRLLVHFGDGELVKED